MLLLWGTNLSLQVYHTGIRVQITPGEYDRGHCIRTCARAEQRPAQTFLDHTPLWNPKLQLRTFFMRRGWQVREVEGSSW